MRQDELTYQTPPQPRQLRLDSTTQCNATCLSCHRFESNRKGAMPVSMVTDILKDVSQWVKPLDEIIPVNYGEFFLSEDWWQILKLINKYIPRTQIVIPTNASQIDSQDIEKFCQISNLKIVNFSVNAYFDDTYKTFVGLPASYKNRIPDLVKGIRVERPDITIRMSMVFDPIYQTDLERDLFVEFWKSQKVEAWIIPAASSNRASKRPCNPVLLPCRSIFSDFVVGYDGKLSSCCFDSGFVLDLGEYSGNLLKDWQNEKMTALRLMHNEHRREGLCGGCTFA